MIIQSRFGREDDDFFFQYLLDRVMDFPNIVDLESNANQDNRLFHFLLFLFPYYLKTAMRKGLFKKYIRCRYNDENVKGVTNLLHQLLHHLPVNLRRFITNYTDKGKKTKICILYIPFYFSLFIIINNFLQFQYFIFLKLSS
ncbi:5-methylcytosine restriction system specificity protein McrC [Parablautia muri]|uniref:5-methylcytosine restriction system specificity protein McrC n=1 Tax=Parablautia muri TaxID=2320879 RepID=UPI002FE6EF15